MKQTMKYMLEAAVVFILIFLLTVSNLFSGIDHMLRDSLYQSPRGVSSQIKIIAIDDRTLEQLGPIQTWSRQYYADIIQMLNSQEDARPAVIAFDILFSGYFGEDHTITDGDRAFAKAAKESGNVIVVSQFKYKERQIIGTDGLITYEIEDLYRPYEELDMEVLSGYSNVAQDSDGTVRRIDVEESYQGAVIPTFSKVIYEEYCKTQGMTPNEIVVDKYGKTLINYSGKPGDYEWISLVDILDGKIDCRTFKDSIVMVGAYANGMQDNFSVPNGNSQQMFGVEIHANILQAFMQGRFAVNGNPFLFGALFGLLGALLHFLFRKTKIWIAAVAFVLAVAGQLMTGVWLNERGTAISLCYFPIVMLVSYIYCLAIGYVLERVRRKKVINAFKKYVAPQVVDEIAKKGDFSISLGGENRDIAVLFVDIRGFTTMSEVLSPEEVVKILNQYLNLTTNAIFNNLGTLDKFVGDATMAVFNSPFDLDDYEFRAVCAAMDIVNGGKKLEEKLMKEFGRTVGFGVGVNCGPAVVGNIGCESRMDFTAIGDTVNTAARLEANAKKGQVLISDVLYERIKERVEVTEIGEIPLKGKAKGVFVYSVTSVKRE